MIAGWQLAIGRVVLAGRFTSTLPATIRDIHPQSGVRANAFRQLAVGVPSELDNDLFFYPRRRS